MDVAINYAGSWQGITQENDEQKCLNLDFFLVNRNMVESSLTGTFQCLILNFSFILRFFQTSI